MAEIVTKLNIFIATPNDVIEERKLLQEVVNTLNFGVASKNKIVLELIKWETHTRPSFGKYPQDVINKQICEYAYDIFICIMWNRLGTPTDSSKSGTLEEFENAYAALHDNNQLKLMLYFNNKPSSIMTDEEILQKREVISFKNSLTKRGIYYCEYNGTDDFKNKIQAHLTQEILNWDTNFDNLQTNSFKNIISINSYKTFRNLKNENSFKKMDDNNIIIHDEGSKLKIVKELISQSNSEICLICYSFTSWKDRIENELMEFLKRGGLFRILMLNPNSRGFYEKLACEAWNISENVNEDILKWRQAALEVMEDHKSDIHSGIRTIKKLNRICGKKEIVLKFYSDSPIFFGYSFDQNKFLVSSYYIDPIKRGFTLPLFFINSQENPYNLFLSRIFSNWFDIKISTGKSVDEIMTIK